MGSDRRGESMLEGLLGSWSATRWHYTNRNQPDQHIDIICNLQGTITLSLSAGNYILTWSVPPRGSASIGGAWAARQGAIEFVAADCDLVESVGYQLGADALSLTTEVSAWDFNGDGREEPAGFVAVFVKL